MIVGYWLLTGFVVVLCLCLGAVSWARDMAEVDLAAARGELAGYKQHERALVEAGRCPVCGTGRTPPEPGPGPEPGP